MLNRANSLLSRYLRLQVVRLPAPRPMRFAPSAAEVAAVEQALAKFALQQAPDDPAAFQAKWRDYLSDRRINAQGEVLEQLTKLDIDLKNKRIGDFGSGMGYLLRTISQLEPTAKLKGFDTFAESNILAKMLCPTATFVESKITDETEPFDVLFCSQVLEHMVEPQAWICKLLAVVKPGGILILSVPNGRTDTHPAYAPREDGSGYWGHIHFWSPESWALFIAASVEDNATFSTTLIESGANVAVIHKS